jgi:hypothetical protein
MMNQRAHITQQHAIARGCNALTASALERRGLRRHASSFGLLLSTVSGQSQRSRPIGGIPPSGDPYALYPSLDLSTIPAHVGSGSWGAQRVIVAPSAPSPSGGSVNVSNQASYETQFHGGNKTITLTANFSATQSVPASAVDALEIIIPSGRHIDRLEISNTETAGGTRRVRIRGDTLGTFSGGTVENLILSGYWTDVHIDGIGITADGVNELPGLYLYSTEEGVVKFSRIAVTNCRIRTACDCSILTSFGTMVIAGCSFSSGNLAYPAEVGRNEAWGIRARTDEDSFLVVYDCDFRGQRTTGEGGQYHRIRLHPALPGTGGDGVNNGAYAWISGNQFVDHLESRLFLVDSSFGIGSTANHAKMDGVWFTGNSSWMEGGSPSFEVNGNSDGSATNDAASYVAHTNNTYYGNFASGNISIADDNNGGPRTGNSYNAITADPAWGGAGDPSSVTWT